MPALSKFLVLLAIFLLARHANAFTCLSPIARNQVPGNHFIQFEESISKQKNEPSYESNSKPIKQIDLDAELPNNLSQKKSQVAYSEPKQDAELPSKITDSTNTQIRGLCHDKKSELEPFADKPGIEQEINHPIAPANDDSQIWQMPTTIKLDSSELWQPSNTEVLATTMTNQNAHLCLASPQSFSSAHVPFSTIHSNLSSRLTSWVQSLAVKVQVSSTPKVSRHAFALLAFEPVTSTTQISSAKTVLKAMAEMQPSANSNKVNNASSFYTKPSSTFQLVVASVDWISKAVSNKPFKTLHLTRIKSKMQPTFKLVFGFKQQYQSQLKQDFG